MTMKLKDIYDLLDAYSKIELRSFWGVDEVIAEYEDKGSIEVKYADTEVVEISQRGDTYLVLYLNRTK